MPELIPFRFKVALFSGGEGGGAPGEARVLCAGAFSEVTGLEASMSPRTVREGGRNYGEVQLAGLTTFSPVVLKRGVTAVADLWEWFDVSTRQANYAYRLSGRIALTQPGDLDAEVLVWHLHNVLPTKFKGPDLSATASQVAVEELTLVHEGITLERPAPAAPERADA